MKNGIGIIWGKIIVIACALLIIVSCASIVSGTKQEVSISSDPPEAAIKILGTGGEEVYTGITPAAVKLKRKSEYDVFISLDGYKEEKIHISKGFNGWYLGNIICGGIIGLIIDASNGAINKLEPDVISVSLATAYKDDGTQELYAVFRSLDSEGQLRTLMVPFVRV